MCNNSCTNLICVSHIEERYTRQSWPQPQQALAHVFLQQHCSGNIPDEPPGLHNTTLEPLEIVIFLQLQFCRGNVVFACFVKTRKHGLDHRIIYYLHCQPRKDSHGLSALNRHKQTGLGGLEWSDSLVDNNPAGL